MDNLQVCKDLLPQGRNDGDGGGKRPGGRQGHDFLKKKRKEKKRKSQEVGSFATVTTQSILLLHIAVI